MQTENKEYILIFDTDSKNSKITNFFVNICDKYDPFTDKQHYIHWYRVMGFYFIKTPIGSEWDMKKLTDVFSKYDELYLIIDITDNHYYGRLEKKFWEWNNKYANLTTSIDTKSRAMKIEKIRKKVKMEENKIRRNKLAYVKSEIKKTADLNKLRRDKLAYIKNETEKSKSELNKLRRDKLVYVKKQIKKSNRIKFWTIIKNFLNF